MDTGLATGVAAEPPPPPARFKARLLPLRRGRFRRSELTALRVPTVPKQVGEGPQPSGQENLLPGTGAVDRARAAAAGRIAEEARP